jgi:hypothetical protein
MITQKAPDLTRHSDPADIDDADLWLGVTGISGNAQAGDAALPDLSLSWQVAETVVEQNHYPLKKASGSTPTACLPW